MRGRVDIREEMKKHRESIQKLEKKQKEERDRIAGAEGAEHAVRLETLEGLKVDAEQAKCLLEAGSLGQPGIKQSSTRFAKGTASAVPFARSGWQGSEVRDLAAVATKSTMEILAAPE